jgi:hypothetical protein
MNVPCEINVEAACKNQHRHSEAGEESLFFNFLKEEILRTKVLRMTKR